MAALFIKRLRINCRRFVATDIHSLNSLLILFESAKRKGIIPECVNLTEDVKGAIHLLGAMHCFSDTYPLKSGKDR